MEELTTRANQLLDELHEIMGEMAQKLHTFVIDKDAP